MLNSDAGAYTPFYLHITRSDADQEIISYSAVLPPGLTGNLTGIPFCPETAIQQARTQSGLESTEHPACPETSRIGHTISGFGVGTVLAYAPGNLYLAGPYHGSALSVVAIDSALVGPFDLGTVVIRFALRINPATAQVEIDSNGSDQIPHILDGIVLHVRDIRVYLDKPGFTTNPTNCDPLAIHSTITGVNPSNPTVQTPASTTTRFQVADCSSLQFKPLLKASTNGKTSRKNGASLNVTLTYPPALHGTQTNIRSVKVDLPIQLPARLETLQEACTDTTFTTNPASCPPHSHVGYATATTPILPVPLTGPAYFVSHGGRGFPELIIVLQGYGITIQLNAETFISKGITSSTLRTIPDQPVTTFKLTLPQGRYSALATNGNPCTTKLTMPTTITAQNNTIIHQNTPITPTNCPKHKNKKKHKTKGHK
jgi:hypothetical protein